MSKRQFMKAAIAGFSAISQIGRSSAQSTFSADYMAPGEFEPQEYIWLSWIEKGSLGSAPFSDVALSVMRAITPHVKVRLMYSNLTAEDASYFGPYRLTQPEAEARLRARLASERVDMTRVELFYYPQPFGAIQDPGPYFLRARNGRLAVADYRFDHPDRRTEAMDRNIANALGLPTVKSDLISEGGARQVNGRGTLLLVEAVELSRNSSLGLDTIEAEHKRVHGAKTVVWLKQGPADEAWGRLPDGKWGIGTGGHVDVFARFADARTILLANVSDRQISTNPVLRETSERMEENFRILSGAKDERGRPFRIIRVPVPDTMTGRVAYDSLSREERSWFEGAKPGDTVEFYLPGGYLNFIIANGIVITARFWRAGMSESLRTTDALARSALQRAFPSRKIVQVDVLPLIYDGGGLHCHSRNQPYAAAGKH
ncbi:agmatine deiminase family protein [Rubrivivax sp. RP6-9]|uniref:agmatine deiminase family protein n=1 Tax=Rubrivivax sp. RP6-9 TaxID=3415750 RepID=UPI003CC59CF7